VWLGRNRRPRPAYGHLGRHSKPRLGWPVLYPGWAAARRLPRRGPHLLRPGAPLPLPPGWAGAFPSQAGPSRHRSPPAPRSRFCPGWAVTPVGPVPLLGSPQSASPARPGSPPPTGPLGLHPGWATGSSSQAGASPLRLGRDSLPFGWAAACPGGPSSLAGIYFLGPAYSYCSGWARQGSLA
jgi:hypothetical protein